MLGFASAEKRQQKADMARAERAFDSVRALPLEMQQDVARKALQECAGAVRVIARTTREQENLCRLRIAELEQKAQRIILESDVGDQEPGAIAAILAEAMLSASSGTNTDYEYLADKIVQWAQNILPDFGRFQSQLAH